MGAKKPALHFVRRQVARILRQVLAGNTQHRALASIKSLVYKPSIVAKKATLALICNTLKYLPVIKDIVHSVGLLQGRKNKGQDELFYVLTHDLLFEQEILPSGKEEIFVLSRKAALRAAFVRLMMKKNVTEIDGLLPTESRQLQSCDIPRYVRVNTLQITVDEALEKLEELGAKVDELLPDLLVLPPGTDLHDHSLVLQGSIFLQSKASCIPAHVLSPDPDWEVLDACASPGNKTVHLAALMKGKGRVTACELHKKRLQVLQDTVKRAGANNIQVKHQDFLKLDPNASDYRKVRAILLDPSCSGSGTTVQRMDHLLPVANDDPEFQHDAQRIDRLASFQKAALCHALSFPAVERVVYSTCSVNQRENEDVVQSVLEHARSHKFKLGTVLPNWPHRGLPVFDGAQHLLRTDALRDKTDGFFVALFVRERSQTFEQQRKRKSSEIEERKTKRKKKKQKKLN
ncbi:probable 28S rRNA (cytosine-C(5))-methyltransferase [Selaginella moellendorffii]|uniref:probable 28S rRNA (cytosine-C(5))-methyltransferase n=1 Tax=Selaginella moellendorffii TaxID=88036 RepID=UPI000D1C3FAA|nr:probable 28S rRNA (cytosine-C(5))-methyltransferase [Selaginella moellendorffii]|eukprot:XP_024540195.1 probable 28S rRNA (cytosine-C(5))-methyltransferase [Selaginella moellendorffii]